MGLGLGIKVTLGDVSKFPRGEGCLFAAEIAGRLAADASATARAFARKWNEDVGRTLLKVDAYALEENAHGVLLYVEDGDPLSPEEADAVNKLTLYIIEPAMAMEGELMHLFYEGSIPVLCRDGSVEQRPFMRPDWDGTTLTDVDDLDDDDDVPYAPPTFSGWPIDYGPWAGGGLSIEFHKKPSAEDTATIRARFEEANAFVGQDVLKCTLPLPESEADEPVRGLQSYTIEMNTEPERPFTDEEFLVVCKAFQKALDIIKYEGDDSDSDETRVALSDPRRYKIMRLDHGEIVLCDEVCPLEADNGGSFLEESVYCDQHTGRSLEHKLASMPKDFIEKYPDIPLIGMMRLYALYGMELIEEELDVKLTMTPESLPDLEAVMRQIRSAFTPDCRHLRSDITPKLLRFFRSLVQQEKEDGTMAFKALLDAFNRNAVYWISGFLGELMRESYVGIEWRFDKDVHEDGRVTLDPYLIHVPSGIEISPFEFVMNFFGDHDYRGVCAFIDRVAEATGMERFDRHEMRLRHLSDDNIVPFPHR